MTRERWTLDSLEFTGHAVRQMFAREISRDDLRAVIDEDDVIADYPEDRPYPSRLFLGFVERRPLHVVLAYDADDRRGWVVTAYEPDPALWEDDFRARRKP